MMEVGNVQIQLIDTPPLNEEYIEPEMLNLLRRGPFGIVHIENDAVQKRTLLRIRWRTIQPGGFCLICEATPTTVGPALNLCQDTVERELAELLA